MGYFIFPLTIRAGRATPRAVVYNADKSPFSGISRLCCAPIGAAYVPGNGENNFKGSFRPRPARSATNKNAWTCPPASAAEQDVDDPRAENKAARVKSTSSGLNLPHKEIGRACRSRVREGEESPEAIPLRRHGKRATGFPQKRSFCTYETGDATGKAEAESLTTSCPAGGGESPRSVRASARLRGTQSVRRESAEGCKQSAQGSRTARKNRQGGEDAGKPAEAVTRRV